jgi:hypothetical protein
MAAYDGEFISQANYAESPAILDLPVPGQYVTGPRGESPQEFDIVVPVWNSNMDSLVVITNHYHKRGWRTESAAYVEWESTSRTALYPDGGTVEPAVGTVMYQWVTYSNGQQPA